VKKKIAIAATFLVGPYGWLSKCWRRSSLTVARWFSKLSRVTLSERIRSASSQSASPSWLDGRASK